MAPFKIWIFELCLLWSGMGLLPFFQSPTWRNGGWWVCSVFIGSLHGAPNIFFGVTGAAKDSKSFVSWVGLLLSVVLLVRVLKN
jgi:hypothetical protein